TDAITRWEARDPAPGGVQTFLPTSDADLDRINSAHDLEAFRIEHRLRNDWHEPDEQGITAYALGTHLDNAMGPTVERHQGELQIVIAKEVEGTPTPFDRSTFQPVAVVNLATLLSWATDGAKSHKALAEAQAQR
ncbi:MAG: hypothetical protein U1C73_03420, partial [Dietzia sp.]|nr:hypothetical protein [Dietzia sp.]